MKRVGSWIVDSAMLFHAGCAHTGYPDIVVTSEGEVIVHRANKAPLKFLFGNVEMATYQADKMIALILEAHAHGSAKKPDGGAA